MNIDLLHKIKAHILAQPHTFRMDTFNCGTAQCIAGWACSLSGRTWRVDSAGASLHYVVRPGEAVPIDCEEDASQLLGLNSHQSFRLFYESSWPVLFKAAWRRTHDLAEKARIAAARIDYFIDTNGMDGVS